MRSAFANPFFQLQFVALLWTDDRTRDDSSAESSLNRASFTVHLIIIVHMTFLYFAFCLAFSLRLSVLVVRTEKLQEIASL